jgi:hypothetical protein
MPADPGSSSWTTSKSPCCSKPTSHRWWSGRRCGPIDRAHGSGSSSPETPGVEPTCGGSSRSNRPHLTSRLSATCAGGSTNWSTQICDSRSVSDADDDAGGRPPGGNSARSQGARWTLPDNSDKSGREGGPDTELCTGAAEGSAPGSCIWTWHGPGLCLLPRPAPTHRYTAQAAASAMAGSDLGGTSPPSLMPRLSATPLTGTNEA